MKSTGTECQTILIGFEYFEIEQYHLSGDDVAVALLPHRAEILTFSIPYDILQY